MYHWILSHPDLAPHLNQARDSRAEALSAGSYQAIKAVGWALDGLVAGVAGLARRYRAWRSRGAAIAGLRRLDNRLLRDIGTDRSEIVSVVLAVEAEWRSSWSCTKASQGSRRTPSTSRGMPCRSRNSTNSRTVRR